MEKRDIVMAVVALIICIFIFAALIYFKPLEQSSNINTSSDHIQQADLNRNQLTWNDVKLRDDTIYNSDGSCYAEHNGMRMYFPECTASTFSGRNIEQYATFTTNITNTTYLFVYTGQLESGKMFWYHNYSHIHNESTISDNWINNYLITDILSYNDLGTPDERCTQGSRNNARMFEVVRRVPNNYFNYSEFYCFTTVTPVNATAFRISGNNSVTTTTSVNGYAYGWDDITNRVEDITAQVPSQIKKDFSWYKVSNVPAGTYPLKWVYTPQGKAKNGKFHVLSFPTSKGITQSYQDGDYTYQDPAWNSTYHVGLQTYYTFNETTGLDFADSTTNNHDLKLTNVHRPDGVIGYGYGTGMYGFNSTGVPLQTFTLNAMVRHSGTFTGRVAFSTTTTNQAGSNGCIVVIAATNTWDIYAYSPSAVKFANPSTGGPSGEWHMLTIMGNATHEVVYWDGTHLTTRNASRDTTWASNLTIGETFITEPNSTGWDLDEFAVWNRTLSAAEITSLCNVNATGDCAGITFSEPEPTTPYFNNYSENPANDSAYSNLVVNNSFNVTIMATNGTVGIEFAGANYSLFNNTASSYGYGLPLKAGTYTYKYWAYNTGSLFNSTDLRYYVLNKGTSTNALTVSPASPAAWGSLVTFSCSNNLGYSVTLISNGTDISALNGVARNLSAGTYNLNCTWNGNENYTYAENLSTYIVSKAGNGVTLLLNGAASNLQIAYPGQVNATGTVAVGTLNLTRDDKEITNAINYSLSVGNYTLNASTTGNANYTGNSTIRYANVTKGNPNSYLTISLLPSGTVVVGNETNVTCSESAGGDGDVSYNMTRNDTLVNMSDVATLGVGTYNYTCYAWGGLNWSTGQYSQILEVTAAPVYYPKYSSVSQSPTNGTQYSLGTNYTFVINWVTNGTMDKTFLEINGKNYTMTNVSTNYSIGIGDLPAGNHNYMYWANDTSGGINKTSGIYTVNKRTPVGSITCDAYSGSYPINITCSATETNTGDSDVNYRLFLDGVQISNPNMTWLNVSTHNYIFNTTGGENISSIASMDSKAVLIINSTIADVGQTYNSPVQELSSNPFTLNMSFDTSVWTSAYGYLIYNNTLYTSTKTSVATGAIFSRSVSSPSVSITANVTFYWNVTLVNSTGTYYYTTNKYNQTVNDFLLDDCSSFTNVIANFSNKDEDTKTPLLKPTYNNTFEIEVRVGTLVFDTYMYYSTNKSAVDSIAICSQNAINGSYRMDATVKYGSTGRVTEYYHIQNFTLTNSTTNQNYSLYDLLTTNSQEFKINLRDNNYIPLQNALVEINRKYVSDGTYYVVEIPKTDTLGSTVGHFVTGDILYTIYIKKENQLLGTFEDIVVYCNPSLTDCILTLNLPSSTTNPVDFESYRGVSYKPSYNDTTRIYTVDFTTTDGLQKNMNIIAYLDDNYHNATICNNTLYAVSGTLTCQVPVSYQNSTALFKLTADNNLIFSDHLNIGYNRGSVFGQIRYVIAGVILIPLLVLMGASSVPVALISFIIGMVLSVGLLLVNSRGYLGAMSFVIWFILAAVIILIKYLSRNRQDG